MAKSLNNNLKKEKAGKNDAFYTQLTDLGKELRGLVGFKVSIDKIDVAYQLSQNRNQIDYFSIINELQKLNTAASNLLASEMQSEYKSNDMNTQKKLLHYTGKHKKSSTTPF